ncbi:MAG: class I SAM-dependent methyltransferase [Candidatus Tyrphobacter sp.]
MRNILDEKPADPIEGRRSFSVGWVAKSGVRGKKILDVGCGYGWFEHHLLECGVASITGTERLEEDLLTARENIADPRAQFCVGSALELPFGDASFDAVVSWEVIEHIPKGAEAAMFREARRVLRQGGSYYISTPHSTPLCNITDPAWWLIGHRHYSIDRLQGLGRESGLEVVEAFVKGGIWAIAASLDMYISKWLLHRRQICEQLMRYKQDEEFSREDGFVNAFAKYRKP